MESVIIFKGKTYACTFEIDNAVDPCFVFVTLQDKSLIAKFGSELTIKTDFKDLLPFEDECSELKELRQSILDAIKNMPEMIFAKLRIEAYKLKRGTMH